MWCTCATRANGKPIVDPTRKVAPSIPEMPALCQCRPASPRLQIDGRTTVPIESRPGRGGGGGNASEAVLQMDISCRDNGRAATCAVEGVAGWA